MPNARFKPTSSKKSGVDGGGDQSGTNISWPVISHHYKSIRNDWSKIDLRSSLPTYLVRYLKPTKS